MKEEDMKQEIPDFTNKENLNLTYAHGKPFRNAYSREEIYEIEALINQKISVPSIAKRLGRSYPSLKNEIKAHKVNGKYSAEYSWSQKNTSRERQKAHLAKTREISDELVKNVTAFVIAPLISLA